MVRSALDYSFFLFPHKHLPSCPSLNSLAIRLNHTSSQPFILSLSCLYIVQFQPHLGHLPHSKQPPSPITFPFPFLPFFLPLHLPTVRSSTGRRPFVDRSTVGSCSASPPLFTHFHHSFPLPPFMEVAHHDVYYLHHHFGQLGILTKSPISSSRPRRSKRAPIEHSSPLLSLFLMFCTSYYNLMMYIEMISEQRPLLGTRVVCPSPM